MRKTVLRVHECEERLVPAAAIDSGYETYAWVLVNTLRQNPAAFANGLQGLASGAAATALGFRNTDPVAADLKALIAGANFPANYAASLHLMRSTPGAGPLAWDELLEYRAHVHTDWMKANGFAHTATSGGRPAVPGFSKNVSAPADTWGYGPPAYASVGEDIGWAVGQARNTKAAYNTGAITYAGFQQRAAFLDTVAYVLELNSPTLGHLRNLLARDNGFGGGLPAFNVIGIDADLFQAPAGYEAQDGVPEAWLSTHRFGLTRPNGSGGFVSGVAFQDNNSNRFYDVGEGVGLTVHIRNPWGGGVTTNTDAFGAFSEYVPNGTYTVTFESGGQAVGSRTVSINNTNAWADFQIGAIGRPHVTGPHGTLGALRPTITWTPVDGAHGYQVRVDDLTTGATDVFNQATTGGTGWAPHADLVSGRTYRVWVRAVRGGDPGMWGNPADFTIARPTRLAPGRVTHDLRPDLAWGGIAGAVRYEVRLDDVSGKRTDIFPHMSTTNLHWEVPGELVSGRTYTWQVRAVNAQGLGAWGPAGTFVVGRPVLTGPGNGVTHLRPTFTWDMVGAVTAYEVRVHDVSGNRPDLYAARVYTTNWTPPADLVSGRTYTWQVRAVNAQNLGQWSAPRTLVLGRPDPHQPAGQTYNHRPTFTWSGVGMAPLYEVRLDDLTTGQAGVRVATALGLDWTPPTNLEGGHTYRWYARAVNADGLGMWSPGQDFRVI